MAAKKPDNTIVMLLLAAAGYYWYKKNYGLPAPAATTATGMQDVPAGAAGTFINYAGVADNVNTANNQFNMLISEGFVNKNANALGLSSYEKDVVYKDFKSGALLTTDAAAHVHDEANKVWAKYPGLKV